MSEPIHNVNLELLRLRADRAEDRLRVAVALICPGPHIPVQHRDMKEPWCPRCGRSARGILLGTEKMTP